MALLSYGSTYIFKPLGGIVFGHIGDTKGRKVVLGSSILLMSFPSVIVGSLPTYADIGVWAPISLILCRVLQSFSEGGETPGAAVFLVESSKKNNVAFYSSLIGVAIYCGGILGSLIGYCSVTSSLPEWSWRIPFWFGGVLGIIGFYIRFKALESPKFKEIQKKGQIKKVPFLEVFKNHKKSVLCNIGLASGIQSIGMFNIAYIPFISKTVFSLETSQVLLLTTFFMGICIFFLLLHGVLADRFGNRKWMILGSIFCCIFVPFVLHYADTAEFFSFVLMQIALCFFFCALKAPLNAITTLEFFPTNVTFTANAFCWGLSGAFFGGLTPLICQLLKDWTGSFWGPSCYVIFCQLLALTAIYFAPNVLKNKSA